VKRPRLLSLCAIYVLGPSPLVLLLLVFSLGSMVAASSLSQLPPAVMFAPLGLVPALGLMVLFALAVFRSNARAADIASDCFFYFAAIGAVGLFINVGALFGEGDVGFAEWLLILAFTLMNLLTARELVRWRCLLLNTRSQAESAATTRSAGFRVSTSS